MSVDLFRRAGGESEDSPPSEERLLSEVLREFARTLVTDFPIQAILDHLVVRIVDVLPISAAGVTLITPGANPRYVAASDDSALRFEKLQTEIGEGPCIVAYETGEPVAISDLRDDAQFPRFAPRAVEEGLMAVFTFPLTQGSERLGALDLYRSTVGPLDPAAMEAARTLADVASAYLINAQARADLRESSERMRQTSLHDPLTGLPNRTLLVQRLEHAILRCRRSQGLVAVLFVDLDRFKAVNDTHGHRTGDELLIAVGERLVGLVRPGDTVARLSGDEFVVVCEELAERSGSEALAGRLSPALAQPFILSEVEVVVGASVGIAFADGTSSAEGVLEDADRAMYEAKRMGGGRDEILLIGQQPAAKRRAELERHLRTALASGELRTAYQPLVAAADARIIGVEALLRWAHPTQGLVSPSTTVSLAEGSGLISEIGRWVLERACRDRQRWLFHDHDHDTGLGISVNVSAHQLLAPGFARTVEAVLADTDTDPASVTLEVTESIFAQDSERALVVMNLLKHVGVTLALDDFGTGHSSLSYLQRFPIDVVKIDRVLVADLGRNPTSRLIVRSIIDLAHRLHMTVVAEGVESPQQHADITRLSCDSCQGYYFARPMPAEELGMLLASGGGQLPATVRSPRAALSRD